MWGVHTDCRGSTCHDAITMAYMQCMVSIVLGHSHDCVSKISELL